MSTQAPTPHPFLTNAIALVALAVLASGCGNTSSDEMTDDNNHDNHANHNNHDNHSENHDNHADNHADNNDSEDACGEHGEMHDEHCHCDEGYTEVDGTCVEDVPVVDMDMGMGDEDMSPDQGGEEDMGQDQGPDEPSMLAFDPPLERGSVGTGEGGDHLWLLEAVQEGTILRLELYEAYGAPTQPGSVTLNAMETNYATCGTCIILQTGCEAHGDHLHCDATFMPEAGGTVNIDEIGTSVGSSLTGSLEGITFREVSIAQDYETSDVAGGQRLLLSPYNFDVTLEALGGSEPTEECGGHGHLHGSHCHCDPGYQVDPQDPANCISE